jgi:hypothetical protein
LKKSVENVENKRNEGEKECKERKRVSKEIGKTGGRKRAKPATAGKREKEQRANSGSLRLEIRGWLDSRVHTRHAQHSW